MTLLRPSVRRVWPPLSLYPRLHPHDRPSAPSPAPPQAPPPTAAMVRSARGRIARRRGKKDTGQRNSGRRSSHMEAVAFSSLLSLSLFSLSPPWTAAAHVPRSRRPPLTPCIAQRADQGYAEFRKAPQQVAHAVRALWQALFPHPEAPVLRLRLPRRQDAQPYVDALRAEGEGGGRGEREGKEEGERWRMKSRGRERKS